MNDEQSVNILENTEEIVSIIEDNLKLVKQIPIRRKGKRIGRNELCPCNSGIKFKKCCLRRRNEV